MITWTQKLGTENWLNLQSKMITELVDRYIY
jgi:hypothetical protein